MKDGVKLKTFIYLSSSCSSNSSSTYTTEEVTGCTNEAAKEANKKVKKTCLLVFLFHVFSVSVIPSINTFEYFNDFMRFIISLISSFKINKVNPFRTLTAPFPLNFLSNLCTAFRVRLLATSGKLSLARERAKFVSIFFLVNYLTKKQKFHLTQLF